MMAIGFIVGGILCGCMGFFIASVIAMENKNDEHDIYMIGFNIGYAEGYDAGLEARTHVDLG